MILFIQTKLKKPSLNNGNFIKKIAIIMLIGLAVSGCNQKSEKVEETQNAQQATSNISPPKATMPDMTATYKNIQTGLVQLKNMQDPKLNEILDIVETAGADGLIDQQESRLILETIQLHKTVLSNEGTEPPTTTQAQPPATSAQQDNGDITKNPNPFQ